MTQGTDDRSQARAAKLRKQIDGLVRGERASEVEGVHRATEASTKKRPSAREFIHERMRELDEKTQKNDKSPE